MAITKLPLIRYKVLDKCFRNKYRKYYIEDLVEACNDTLCEIGDGDSSVKLRQIRSDIAFMKSPEGWNIELDELLEGKKKIYRYVDTEFSINNLPLNESDIYQLKSAFNVLSQFDGMPQFEWLPEILAKLENELKQDKTNEKAISFDSNSYLKGIKHFSTLHNAICKKIVLTIEYKDFVSTESYPVLIHPYFLKQYNNRWYLFGYFPENGKSNWILALDRIINIKESEEIFKDNTDIDWDEYFEDYIGVSIPENSELVDITLHFYGITGNYIETKPIHGSQKAKWLDKKTFEVKLNMIINYELENLILSFAESVKVLAPKFLANKIHERLKAASESY